MGRQSSTVTNRQRMREAGVNPADLRWFLAMAPESELDKLPAEALYLPGQSASHGDTLIDLTSGRPIYLRETVPSATVFCLLGPLKPVLRTEARQQSG